MKFSTKVPIGRYTNTIDYSSRILSIGSCFAENIGAKFDYYKFKNNTNPFGIIFNPVSIEKLVARAINNIPFTEADVFYHNERYHCYEVHSDRSEVSSKALVENLNNSLRQFVIELATASHIIITYGTSWVYQLKQSGAVVANCHKVPQTEFDKVLLPVEDIEQSIKNTIELIQSLNPKCALLFTISPVRHIKDGYVGNQTSKAHLITAIHKIINYQLSVINYFPSYEIMMDELRDYRYYGADMLHPNEVAVDYIWERFCESVIAEESYGTMDAVGTIQKGLAHRPFNPHSESHQEFLSGIKVKIEQLQEKFPFMWFNS